MKSIVEFFITAAAYKLLRDNVGRPGVVFFAAATIYKRKERETTLTLS